MVFLTMKFAALVAILILIGSLYLYSNLGPQNSTQNLARPDFSGLSLALAESSSQFETLDLEALLNLESIPNRGLILISLWAHWCWPCLVELPLLNRIYEELQQKGLIVLAVNLDENPEEQFKADAFWSDQGLSMASSRMSLKEFQETFPASIRGIPFHALLDSEGQILWSKHGALDWAHPQVLQDLTDLLTKK